MPLYKGGCLCGAVRYTVDADPIPGRRLLCHCEDCQRQTGSAFAAAAAFPSDRVVVTGDMTTFTMPGGQTGEPMHRRFCRRCGSSMTIHKDGTGRMLIMAGTLDDKSLFTPEVNLFCDFAPAWVTMPANCENHARYFS
ncbi:MAG TPA: GFA family protein [Acetobacteraceae bacterium]|nr:GFA family protein [Acetobacteraceae bacterium]